MLLHTINPAGMAGRATAQNDVRQLVGKDYIPLRGKILNVLSCAFKVSLVWKGAILPGVVC